MFSPLTPVYRSLSLLAMCILLTISFSACSGGGSDSGGDTQQSDSTGDPIVMPPGTGGLAFQLVWGQPSSSGAKAAKLSPSFDACNDYAIATISATVSNGTATVTNSWPCSAHKGLLLGVPAGTNYTVRVDGMSSAPTTTIWRGQTSSPITVTTQQIANAGTIAMSFFATDAANPTVTTIGPRSSPTSTMNVPITDRINIVFSEPMAISTLTSANITIASVSGNVTYDSASNTASFTPSANLANNTQYVLQVASNVTPTITDMAAKSLLSNYTFTFTTESTPSAAPGVVSGVTATAGYGQVTLDWIAVNGAVSYNVYYSTSSCPTSTTTGTPLTGVQAPSVHLGLANGATYCYVVTAVNGSGESPISASASATPAVPTTNPVPPAEPPTVDFITVSNQHTISWPAVTGATGYNLYWSTRPINPNKTAADNVIRYVTSPYVHTGVTSGTYCYIVTAMNSNGESADSMQVCGPGSVQIFW